MAGRAERVAVRAAGAPRRGYRLGFPLRGGRKPWSSGSDDFAGEDEMIAIAVTGISRIIGKRPKDPKAEAADLSLCLKLREIGQEAVQRIEKSPVITEFDLQPPGVKGEVDLDPALGGLVVAVVHGIGEQLLENDQEPNPLSAGQSMATGEPLGKADQVAEFVGVAAQAEECSHLTSIRLASGRRGPVSSRFLPLGASCRELKGEAN